MGVLTSQQITKFYDIYRDTEVTFTKEIIRNLHLDPRQVYIKCAGSQWPCIINSTSFQSARIILGTKGGAYAQIKEDISAPISLRFSFAQPDAQPVSFFVTSRATHVEQYMKSNDLAIITLTFTQRPPDDLIETIGRLLEANANAIRRKEERIVITPDSKRKLSITKEETLCYIQNVPRHCIIRDLSFSGSKIILMGLPNFLKDKPAVLSIEFEEPREIVQIPGQIVQAEFVEGRKDLVTVSVRFLDDSIPMAYKLHINNYLTAIRKKQLDVVYAQDAVAPQAN